MPYSLPEFNIEVEIQHYAGSGVWGLPQASPAQLKGMPRATLPNTASNPVASSAALLLKLPKGTDVRDDVTLARADRVYLPGWNGEPCYVQQVYDVAFGFPNEYRVAVLARSNGSGAAIARPEGQGEVPAP